MTHLLLVEDERGHVELIRRAFHCWEEEMKISVASNLSEARACFATSIPDIALIDYLLPDGAGLELLPGDKSAPLYPIIIMTSHGNEEVAVDAMKAGALDYVVKSEETLAQMPHIVERSLREWQHIQQRQQAETALHQSEERYRILYDDTPSMFFTVDAAGTIQSVNKFGAQQLGYRVKELLGTRFTQLYPKTDSTYAQEWFEMCMRVPSTVHRWEASKLRKDGSRLWVRTSGRVVHDLSGKPVLLIVCEDITQARNLSQKLNYQATHDALTDLVNRREFEHRLQRVLENCLGNEGEHALCYLDLDQFKVINDTCGHIAGDELLRQISAILQDLIRKRDTLGRLGGDEFGVLMEHCSLKQAQRVANALRRTISEFRFHWQDKTFNIGVSIGLVPINKLSESITNILSAADTACYTAKDQGRNRIHIYYEGDQELSRRRGEMRWVAHINEAIEQNRLRLFGQPIQRINSNEDRKLHYEFLLRIEEPSGEFALPGSFLPAAERYNLTARIDRWVIDTAITWLHDHPNFLPCSSLYAINLSGQSLVDDEFHRFVIDRIGKTQIPPQVICFEITETAAITNLSRAAAFITALKALGCKFSLDDFGSGLSSFGYLKTLPVDYLKIDGQFVKDILRDPIDLAMVKSINEIGHIMGKQTIAEYVENKAILEKLVEIGVDYAQGYYIGKPCLLAESKVP